MATKKTQKIDIKKVTRAATVGVMLAALAGLGLTGWFIMHTLNSLDAARSGVETADLRAESINNQLLEKIETNIEKKTSSDQALSDELNNPFKKPPPEPEREPQPAPAPPSEPPPAPPPST